MKEELIEIILMEILAIRELLGMLEKQHDCLINSDAITLESCVTDIEACNRKVAEMEVRRRQLTKGRPMSEIVYDIGDEDLEAHYREIRKLLEEVKLQKDTNELLIRQGLSFTNRVLNIINPSRTSKTYNSYGKVSR